MLHSKWLPPFLVAAFLASPAASAQTSPSPVLTPAQLFEKASPAVVKLVLRDEDDRPIGSASGFVIEAPRQPKWPLPYSDQFLRRWIVTNYHVVQPAVSITVDPAFVPPQPNETGDIFANEYGRANLVLAENPKNDVAVLAAFGWDLPSLTIADDANHPIGTPIFVISSPEGLKNTLSEGLISGFRERENGEQWIQISAPISPGSSGGPVLTADGKVIGVVVATREDGQNLNFAVPVKTLRNLIEKPPLLRPLWKGTSIQKEESDALDLWLTLYLQTCPVGTDRDECAKKLQAKRESGDQLALLVQAREEYKRDSPGDCVALATLKRAIAAKPSEWEYLAYFYLGKLTSNISLCGTCILQRASGSFVYSELAARCFDPAIPFLKKSTELNPKFSPSFKYLADAYLRTEKYPEVLVSAEFLVALVPNCWEAHLLRGKAFAYLKRISAAEEDFATATKLRPGWFDLYNEIFSTFSDIDSPRSFDAGKAALGIPLPADEQWRRGLLWYNMGNTYRRLGDYDNAARAFEEHLRMGRQTDPQFGSPEIVNWLAHYRADHP